VENKKIKDYPQVELYVLAPDEELQDLVEELNTLFTELFQKRPYLIDISCNLILKISEGLKLRKREDKIDLLKILIEQRKSELKERSLKEITKHARRMKKEIFRNKIKFIKVKTSIFLDRILSIQP